MSCLDTSEWKAFLIKPVTLLEFLLNLNSLQSDFSRPFFLPDPPEVARGEKTFISYLKLKNNKGKHKGKNTMRTAEETVNSAYCSSKRRL